MCDWDPLLLPPPTLPLYSTQLRYLFSPNSFNPFSSFKFQTPPQRCSRFLLSVVNRGERVRSACSSGMKRPLSCDVAPATGDDKKMKKVKLEESDEEPGNHQTAENPGGSVYFDENLLFEVLKHVDAKTLAMAGCVSKQWYKTAQDERLWELICSKQWANTGCSQLQLRTVVLALGGFRRLHALYLGPLSKPQRCSTSSSASASASSSSSWAAVPKVIRSKPQSRLGKDEVHLSLCLMSISCYEKMNFNKSNR